MNSFWQFFLHSILKNDRLWLVAFCLMISLPSLAGQVSGIVRDAENAKPLAGANISLLEIGRGAVSDGDGAFILKNIPEGRYTLQITFLGYKTFEKTVNPGESSNAPLTIDLQPTPLRGRGVVVVATRATDLETPAAFSTLSQEDLQARYHTQDIPALLSDLPSTTFYSEGGNAIGYNYLSIRGFDQRRISVMVNGVPQNDPEDHNIYWINFPDFLSSVEDIQVQRGAGSAFFGPPAIGGSINIITEHFSDERRISVHSGFGSYNTSKVALGYNSGLINNRLVLNARVSQIQSDSYRKVASVDMKGFFAGAAYFGERSSTRLHIYGGPVEDQLAYLGISKEMSQDRETRRENPISNENEIENFNQPHIELINDFEIGENLTLRNTIFGIRGYGFFDYDGSWAPLSYYRLTRQFGFDVDGDPENIYADQVLIRAYVDNRQGGWFPNVSYRGERLNLNIGSELRFHRSLHWGRMQEASGAVLPRDTTGSYSGLDYIGSRRYYEYKGGKNIIAPYAQAGYQLNPVLNVNFALQYVHQNYKLYDEAFLDNEFSIDYNFLNPRIGVNLSLTPQTRVFASFSRTSREPRLKNYYDAAEASTPASWGAIVPQFEQDGSGNFDFDNPLVKPERLNDYELGFSFNNQRQQWALNLFYMDFADEIVKSGQLDRFGQPITGNAEKTFHTGLELSGAVRLNRFLSANGNLTFSRNELSSYTVFGGDGTPLDLGGNTIAGFPDFLGNLYMNFQYGGFNGFLAMKHVGKQYTDNFQDEANTVDAYTVFNGMIGYDFERILPLPGMKLQFFVQNLFDVLYNTHGEGDAFFPAAERHFFGSLKFEL